jgi:hypothetical protein
MMTKKNMLLMKRIGLITVLLALVPAMSFAKTIYVKENGTGNGTSWIGAYGSFQSALNAANSGDQIWVAAGTYKPGSKGGFTMKNGVRIYGGFAGYESSLSQRNIDANETVLSGDLNGDDGPDFTNRDDNCISVFYHPDGTNLNATAVLDGFTIESGNAGASGGGGMYNFNSSPTVANCAFIANVGANSGGGMMNESGSHPTVTNCAFLGNFAWYSGGGMANIDSSPTVINCIFQGNEARYTGGGGMYNYYYCSPTVTNCTFSGNSAGKKGGGMSVHKYSNATVTNCIFWGNLADESNNQIETRVDATTNISYSSISGCLAGGTWDTSLGTDGGGNMDANPYFDAFLQLQSPSPCIDAADGDAAPATDFLGNGRYDDTATPNSGTGTPNYADMGAYEYQAASESPAMPSPPVPQPAVFINSLGASGVLIDSSVGQPGPTSYDYAVTIAEGTTVSLTAPAVWGLKTFAGWTGSVTSSNEMISLNNVDISKLVMARYETSASSTYRISVYDSGVTGVPITSATGHGGATDYSTDAIAGTAVSLTAPATADGKTLPAGPAR